VVGGSSGSSGSSICGVLGGVVVVAAGPVWCGASRGVPGSAAEKHSVPDTTTVSGWRNMASGCFGMRTET
jgi:hypothetical protein